MLNLLCALFCVQAAAAGHTLEVRVHDGKTTYAKAFAVNERDQGSHVLPVKGKNGAYQEMLFNALLAPVTRLPGTYELQYQLELSGGRDAEGPSIQSQSDVLLRAGEGLLAVECGRWKVELLLDKAKTAARNVDGNLGVSAELSGGKEKAFCRQAVRLNSQANVVDSFKKGGKKHGFILNLLPADAGKSVSLQYQVGYTPLSAPAGSFQAQGEESLTLGTKSVVRKSGYQLALTAEGKPIFASKGEEQGGPAKSDENGAVPLLR